MVSSSELSARVSGALERPGKGDDGEEIKVLVGVVVHIVAFEKNLVSVVCCGSFFFFLHKFHDKSSFICRSTFVNRSTLGSIPSNSSKSAFVFFLFADILYYRVYNKVQIYKQNI